MASTYEDIIESRIFKFVVGSGKKEYSVHATAFSVLSKPLEVLLNGPHKEAQELRVVWPDIDEKTFIRFTQWAYTRNYVTEEPVVPTSIENGEEPLYSVASCANAYKIDAGYCCCNSGCAYFKSVKRHQTSTFRCLICRESYMEKSCWGCGAAFSGCPKPACKRSDGRRSTTCSNSGCQDYNRNGPSVEKAETCLRCRMEFIVTACVSCGSNFSDCPFCTSSITERRYNLMNKFLDKEGTNYPTPTSIHWPRKNTNGGEDYSGVFLCHAKLYVHGDTYDIPLLRQLCLHRLHALLKEFTIYPSRLNDISILARYVFTNTRSGDKIQEMITEYYARIIEDAWRHEGLKSLIDEIRDFAFGLISRMSERLA